MRAVCIALCCLVLFCHAGARLSAQEAQGFDCAGFNVVLISLDAMQVAHVSCLGYPRKTTPLLDEFAQKGFLFTQAISQSSWTVPATMTWFTSLYPSEHKVINKYSRYTADEKKLSNLEDLSPGTMTLAQVLKEHGYATGGFTGDAGVGARFGFGKGFDSYVDDQKFAGFDHSIPYAIAWLNQHKAGKFFIFLHGYDCHGQYDPAAGYTKRFLDFPYRGKLSGGKDEQGRLREEGLEKGHIDLNEKDVRFWRALYDEKINDADQRVRLFIDELKKLGLLEKTIIVFTADHGTEFYEHKRFDHGFTLYDELIHVPLVIYVPSVAGGVMITDQVRGIDIFPTVLDLLGIEPSAVLKKQMRGTSLLPLLRGQHLELPAFSETDYRLYAHKRSIRTADGWKLILSLDTNARELYNLKSDPQEKYNLIAKEQARAYELEQLLFRWLDSTGTKASQFSGRGELKIKEY